MQTDDMQQWLESSVLNGGSSGYLDDLYEQYLQDPALVPDMWRQYFDGLPKVNGGVEVSHAAIRHQFAEMAKHSRVVASNSGTGQGSDKQALVAQFIEAYRSSGHLHADLDPLELYQKPTASMLNLSAHGLSDADLNTKFSTGTFFGHGEMSLGDLRDALRDTYSNHIGFQYKHLSSQEQITWLQQQIEPCHAKPKFSDAEKKLILSKLIAAEGLEKYLATRYVGQKRFGLEGGESCITSVHELIQRGAQHGVREMVLGMAHRGRLNVLVNELGKSPEELFDEFEGKKVDESRAGDVKYHLGFSSDVETSTGDSMHLTMAFNPSHLECVYPVVEGSVRARQNRRADSAHDVVCPIIIHGDAALSGQGVVMETLNMSQLEDYTVGGTIHIVINNQIGFTTNPQNSRSGMYCTDVGKMVEAPIFHVNGDDPEAVAFVSRLALDFRTKFHRDVFIDVCCYRRHGHNEADDPAMTQPIMYATIKKHPSVCKSYGEKLVAEGVVDADSIKQQVADYRDALDAGKPVGSAVPGKGRDKYAVDWTSYLEGDLSEVIDTGVPAKTLEHLADRLADLPEGFTLPPIVAKELNHRRDMAYGKLEFNWGGAENLAYASIINEGHGVRLTGQDSGRGTFSHRLAECHDRNTGETYTPLHHISDTQAQFEVVNSPLSEEAAVGFEYGFSTAEPQYLVVWEAQFGDFANGAQVYFDQFLSSGEQKWNRLCGLSLLLPHGYEGMGAEHSSARLERFLQLCAEHNMQVCVPSTPSQIFHLLRRQAIRKVRKPLVVMSPKSLLRHKLATSPVDSLVNGSFHLVIHEIDELAAAKVKRVVLCSGKVYYDLLQQRRENKQGDVALVRVEQLYPFPEDEVKAELAKYSKATQVIWCQEEPMNQGAWYSTRHRLQACLGKGQTLDYVGRPHSAAPAVGSPAIHKKQQQRLVTEALTVK